jgi:hypothetical protein
LRTSSSPIPTLPGTRLCKDSTVIESAGSNEPAGPAYEDCSAKYAIGRPSEPSINLISSVKPYPSDFNTVVGGVLGFVPDWSRHWASSPHICQGSARMGNLQATGEPVPGATAQIDPAC